MRSRQPDSEPAPLPDPLLERLSDQLAAATGLHFPRERWGDLERGIRGAASDLGADDAETCVHRLLAGPLSRGQIEVLAHHLTVGETYFFREPATFAALEEHVLPELMRARAAERRLRIWSAACCTGEEPYSLAMLLDRLLPRDEAWHVTILATDINPSFLRRARAGVYGNWSFRATPTAVRDRYFRKRRDGRFELDVSLRRRVTFSYLNLAEDIYPSLTGGTNAMDLVLCRNVLMYFAGDQSAAVTARLYRALAPGGWLAVSPVESFDAAFRAFEPIAFPGATLYRRGSEKPLSVAPVPRPTELESPLKSAPQAALSTRHLMLPGPVKHERQRDLQSFESFEALAAAPVCNVSSAAPLLAAARRCADEGSLNDAAQLCQRAIANEKLDPTGHYLLATVQRELGDDAAAAESLRRAIYLDPAFVLAHFALGTLALAHGRRRDATRNLENASALAARRSPDECLPESEGLTARRLVEIVASLLASLRNHDDGANPS